MMPEPSPTIRIEWTPRLVAAFLADAAQSVQCVSGSFDATLQTQVASSDACGPLQLSADLSQAKAALHWLSWLDTSTRRLAWNRATGMPWKAIAHAHGIDRTTAWRRWTCALITIASRLNAISDATTLQHREAGPDGANTLP